MRKSLWIFLILAIPASAMAMGKKEAPVVGNTGISDDTAIEKLQSPVKIAFQPSHDINLNPGDTTANLCEDSQAYSVFVEFPTLQQASVIRSGTQIEITLTDSAGLIWPAYSSCSSQSCIVDGFDVLYATQANVMSPPEALTIDQPTTVPVSASVNLPKVFQSDSMTRTPRMAFLRMRTEK